jgi:hypothetical protein
MVKQVWGKHSTVATGTNDTGKQVSVNVWNESLNRKGLLGFDAETIVGASDITIPADTSSDSSDGSTSSFIKLSGATSVDKFITTNTTEGDLLYLITTGSVTLNNVSSPSVAGQIRLLADGPKDLSTTVPTILMRISDYWYEYGGGTVSDGSVTNAKLADMAANTIKVRNANSSGVPSDIALATTQILIGDGTGFTAAALSGDVSMDNTGDVTVGTLNQSTTGSSASCTGLSATATALATGRTIGGSGSFDGTGNVNVANLIVADTTDTTCSVALFEDATGDNVAPKTDAGLTYNASTGMLTATGLTGPLTGNADTASNATLAAGLSAQLVVASGGTNLTSYAVGDIVYASGTTAISKLAKPGTPAGEVLTFAVGASAPSWVAAGGSDTPWSVVHDFDTYYYDMEIQSKPADPSADNARFYVKEVDTDNDGVFCIIRKNGAFEETQIV